MILNYDQQYDKLEFLKFKLQKKDKSITHTYIKLVRILLSDPVGYTWSIQMLIITIPTKVSHLIIMIKCK
jgi:hypothetical protein